MSAFVQNEKNGLIYMTSPVIGAKHAFSTRFGGVSEGGLASLNLGFNRGDVRERVIENYRLLGAALGLDVMRAAYTKQVHGTHVRLVTDADRCGPTDPAPCDADGLVTTSTRKQPFAAPPSQRKATSGERCSFPCPTQPSSHLPGTTRLSRATKHQVTGSTISAAAGTSSSPGMPRSRQKEKAGPTKK